MGCILKLLPSLYWPSCGDIPDGFPRIHTNALHWSGCLPSQQHIVDSEFTANATKLRKRQGSDFRKPCDTVVCCDEKSVAEHEGRAT